MGQTDSFLESLLVVIPVYNHLQSLRSVVFDTLELGYKVLVIDDGSSEQARPLVQDLGVHVIRHRRNMGKGQAILTAAEYARQQGKTHIVTLDADGQHYPHEICKLVGRARENPLSIVVGSRIFTGENIPGSSRFGRAFSNFWVRMQTGAVLKDVQSGMRIYPVLVLSNLKCRERGYAFEVEVLVRALWAGFSIEDVEVDVFYPKPEKRVSHFKKFRDNLKISLLNTRLTLRAALPVPHRKYVEDDDQNITALYPLQSLKILLKEDKTPLRLAASGALGMFIGSFPIFGLHYISLMMFSSFFKLNKITALAANQLCMPPIVPALCIELGYFMRNGKFLTEISLQTLGYECFDRLLEWMMGALLFGPLAAGLIFICIYMMSLGLQKSFKEQYD